MRRWLAIGLMAAARVGSAPPALAQSSVVYGGFFDAGLLSDVNRPSNHLFRNKGTTPKVDEVNVNMAALFVSKTPSDASRWGIEATVQTGQDSRLFGFSATAPNLGGAGWLRHLGPTDVSYRAPIGRGLAIQAGIFSSVIGYDSLYAKDNGAYTRPWGADYTPYLMMGVNAAYPISSRLTLTGVLVNGYFHLAHANDAPSVGAQAAYKPSEAITVKQAVLAGSHQTETALRYWRWLSDTIVERRSPRVVAAGEYQVGIERVAANAGRRALWMSAQAPLRWAVGGPISLVARPEFCWDRNGRWIGAPQSIAALTAGVEYHRSIGPVAAVLRVEYRVDDSHGRGAGFFTDADNHLTPAQHLIALGALLTWTTSHP
jgi:putative OmpL-like beta-barrel porin-2